MGKRSSGALWAGAIWLGAVGTGGAAQAAEHPSALQVCFDNLDPKEPLFADKAGRNYRAMSSGAVLDMELTVDGARAEKLTKSSANCVRAWIPPATVHTISASFDRTDTNFRPATHGVKLKLLADKWHDGGTIKLDRAPFTQIHTSLPGKLEVERQEPAGGFKWEDLERVPRGRYILRHTPPEAAKGACPTTVVAEAVGTVTEKVHPEILAELIHRYETEIAPDVLRELKETCVAGERVELRLVIVDGVYRNPRAPQLAKATIPGSQKVYSLLIDGKKVAYNPGETFDVGFGQTVELQ
jgi:hypothetical protein